MASASLSASTVALRGAQVRRCHDAAQDARVAGLPKLNRQWRRNVGRRSGDVRCQSVAGPAEVDVYSREENKQLSLWSEPEVLLAAASFESTLDLAQASVDQAQVAAIPLEQAAAEPAAPALEEPNIFARAWAAYSNALETKPILVKSATSLVGFAIGDSLAQLIVAKPFDIFRTMRLVAFGMFMDGPVGHVWYTFLDRSVLPEDPKSNKAVIAKMMLDQIVWAPMFSCIFFTFIHTLEGHPEMVIPTIQSKLWPMYLANLALWPLAHIINFKFVPSSQRILYINCVQILWSAYLSNLASVKMRSKL